MSYQISWEKDRVFANFYDEVTPESHFDAVKDVFGSPSIDEVNSIIVDFSQVEDNFLKETDAEYCSVMTAGASQYLNKKQVALVANIEDIIKFCQHYIYLITKLKIGWECRLFDNVDSATAWISSSN